jgi:hypothetical protein
MGQREYGTSKQEIGSEKIFPEICSQDSHPLLENIKVVIYKGTLFVFSIPSPSAKIT